MTKFGELELNETQIAHLDNLGGKCNFVIQVMPPCKPVLWQWVQSQDIPPTVQEIAIEYGLTIDQAIERSVQLITEHGFGFAKRDVSADSGTVDLVVDEKVYILGSKDHAQKLEEMFREQE